MSIILFFPPVLSYNLPTQTNTPSWQVYCGAFQAGRSVTLWTVFPIQKLSHDVTYNTSPLDFKQPKLVPSTHYPTLTSTSLWKPVHVIYPDCSFSINKLWLGMGEERKKYCLYHCYTAFFFFLLLFLQVGFKRSEDTVTVTRYPQGNGDRLEKRYKYVKICIYRRLLNSF